MRVEVFVAPRAHAERWVVVRHVVLAQAEHCAGFAVASKIWEKYHT